VASAGPYASLHLTLDRYLCQHPTTQSFTGRVPFLPPKQQRQCTEGICTPCLKKNVPPLVCYNFDIREWILIFFGRNVTDKAGNQKVLYYATSNNLFFCTTW